MRYCRHFGEVLASLEFSFFMLRYWRPYGDLLTSLDFRDFLERYCRPFWRPFGELLSSLNFNFVCLAFDMHQACFKFVRACFGFVSSFFRSGDVLYLSNKLALRGLSTGTFFDFVFFLHSGTILSHFEQQKNQFFESPNPLFQGVIGSKKIVGFFVFFCIQVPF